MLKAEPELVAKEIAKRLEISPRAVEKQISKLRKEGLLHRIGPKQGRTLGGPMTHNEAETRYFLINPILLDHQPLGEWPRQTFAAGHAEDRGITAQYGRPRPRSPL